MTLPHKKSVPNNPFSLVFPACYDILMDLHTASMTIVACFAVLTGLSVVFNWLLRPLEKRMDNLEANQIRIENKIDQLIVKSS